MTRPPRHYAIVALLGLARCQAYDRVQYGQFVDGSDIGQDRVDDVAAPLDAATDVTARDRVTVGDGGIDAADAPDLDADSSVDAPLGDACATISCGPRRTCSAGACSRGWVPMAASPLAAREGMFFVIVPARHELILWGGRDGSTFFNDGARYDWTSDRWTLIAPSPLAIRGLGRAVWTGSEMFVWGGQNETSGLGDGALYDPATDSWRAVGGLGAPSEREGYQAFWTGNGVLVQGGVFADLVLTDGAIYDPFARVWSPMPARAGIGGFNAGAWIESALFVYGGSTTRACDTGATSSAYRYSPSAGWISASPTNAPSPRWFQGWPTCGAYSWLAPWTGTEVFVWGGLAGTMLSNTGAMYDPAMDRWRAIAAPPPPLAAGAYLPFAVWTGQTVLGWPAFLATTVSDALWEYDPARDEWTLSAPMGAPPPVGEGAAFGWTGSEFIVWGGRLESGAASSHGARFAR